MAECACRQRFSHVVLALRPVSVMDIKVYAELAYGATAR